MLIYICTHNEMRTGREEHPGTELRVRINWAQKQAQVSFDGDPLTTARASVILVVTWYNSSMKWLESIPFDTLHPVKVRASQRLLESVGLEVPRFLSTSVSPPFVPDRIVCQTG